VVIQARKHRPARRAGHQMLPELPITQRTG
jgi:hypothetical protein